MRVAQTFDFVVDKMQGKSGYFYGIYGSGAVQPELSRDVPADLLRTHPGARPAMVRKNGDVLFWLLKQFMLLREQGNGSRIKAGWEDAARSLAQAFVNTWNQNRTLGQYVDPQNGEIVIHNSTAGAIAAAGLALASKYFDNAEFMKTATALANYYYSNYVARLGMTCGACGDISQDADSETAGDSSNRSWLSTGPQVIHGGWTKQRCRRRFFQHG